MSDELQAEKGIRAQAVFDSEPFQDAIRAVRNGIIEKWTSSPIADVEGQHELRLMLKLLDDLVGNMESVISDGKFAAKAIEHKKEIVRARCGNVPMNDQFSIFIGYDTREPAAYHVCAHSIIKHASKAVSITPIALHQLKGIARPDSKGSTEFSMTRFLTPWLANTKVAMFVDCDFLFLDDVWKLYDMAGMDDVMCVKHDYEPKTDNKFLGAKQYSYPRKNWSSLMLFNCQSPNVYRLTPSAIKEMSPAELHQMQWADCIGEIPKEWNWLVGEYEDRPASELKALHYTLGGPWFGIESAYSNLWKGAYAELKGAYQHGN